MCEQNVTPQPFVHCAHEKNGYEDHSSHTYIAYIDIILLNCIAILLIFKLFHFHNDLFRGTKSVFPQF